MRCIAVTSACDGVDIKPCKLYLRRDPRPVCRGCRGVMEAHGASFTVLEPEPAGPRWLANRRARDETGRLVAA